MSSVVVDTHVIIWDQLDPHRLSLKAKKALAIADESHQIILCEISLWEISILMKKKRLMIDLPYLEFIDALLQTKKYVLQGISPDIAFIASETDIDNRDPADRIIAATSIVLGLPLISADRFMQQSPSVRTIW